MRWGCALWLCALLWAGPSLALSEGAVLTQTGLLVHYTDLPSADDFSGQPIDNLSSRGYLHTAPGYNGIATMSGGVEGTRIGASTVVSAGMIVDVWEVTKTTQWTSFSLFAETFVMASDVLSVDGLGGGGFGTLEYVFLFDGNFQTTFNPAGGAMVLDEIRADTSLRVYQSGIEEILIEDALAPEWFGHNPPVHETRETGDVLVVSERMGFQEAALFPIAMHLRTSVEFQARGIDGGDFGVIGVSDFGSTAEFVGLRVYDEHGALRTDVTVTSESGIEYAVLPEPSSALLVGLGLVGLGVCGRTRGQRV